MFHSFIADVKMCGPKVFQAVLSCSNILILFLGLATLGMGLSLRPILNYLPPKESFSKLLFALVVSQITCGAIMFTSSVIGCFGACYKVVWLLRVYIASMVAVIVFEIGCGIAMLVMQKELLKLMSDITDCKVCSKVLFSTLKYMMTPSALIMLCIILLQAGLIMTAYKLQKHLVVKAKCRKAKVKEADMIIMKSTLPPRPMMYEKQDEFVDQKF